jgi:hypothetical protein
MISLVLVRPRKSAPWSKIPIARDQATWGECIISLYRGLKWLKTKTRFNKYHGIIYSQGYFKHYQSACLSEQHEQWYPLYSYFSVEKKKKKEKKEKKIWLDTHGGVTTIFADLCIALSNQFFIHVQKLCFICFTDRNKSERIFYAGN